MYLIIGLGNPEEEYANTRHNMGFDTINEIAKRNQISLTKKKFQAIYEVSIIEGKKVIDGTNKSLTDNSHINHYMKYKYTKIIY